MWWIESGSKKLVLKGIQIAVVLLCWCAATMAQNLVQNNSLEDYTKCPTGFVEKKLKLKGKVKHLFEAPDYFNACSGNFSPAKNPCGSQPPQDGDGYCGLVLTADLGNECRSREYLQFALSEPLKKGGKYRVSFFTSLADKSGYYTDQIGAYFSTTDLTKKKSVRNFHGKGHISNPLGKFINDTTAWVEVKGVYNAKGGERYILIGNFQDCGRTTRKAVTNNVGENVLKNIKQKYMGGLIGQSAREKMLAHLAYYFVDNVQVSPHEYNDSTSYLTQELACAPKNDFTPSGNQKNLVPDPSFDRLPDSVNSSWFNPGRGTPDFHEGTTGLYMYSGGGTDNREYIMTQLTEKLHPCNTYHFRMKVKRNSSYRYAVDHIEVALTDSNYTRNDRLIFPFSPAFQSPRLQLIDNTTEWMTLCGEMTVDQCSEYLILGNFTNDEKTFVLDSETSTSGGPYAYYFVDDIELYQVGEVPDCSISCEPETPVAVKEKVDEKVETMPLVNQLTVSFEVSQAESTPLMLWWVGQLKKNLDQNEHLMVHVTGHTDNTGPDNINEKLAQKRAQSVREQLLKAGIPASKIEIHAYGSKKPIADNNTSTGRDKNRRVAVTVIEQK